MSVLSRVDDLTEAQRSASVREREAAKAMRAEMRAALENIGHPVAVSTEGDPSHVYALEARVTKSFGAVVEFAEAKLGALAIDLAESRSRLAAVKDETDRRLVEITTWLAAQPTPEALLATFRSELAEVETRLARVPEAQRSELDALSEGLAQARLAIASSEQQLAGSQEALKRLAEMQHDEVRKAVSERTRQEGASLVCAAEELIQARELVESKLDGVVETALDTEVRVNALASLVDEAASRLQALEESTRESIDGLTTLIDSERRAREAAEAKTDKAGRERRAAVPAPAPPAPNLLDSLERQLREAEARLARRVETRGLG